MSILHTRGCGRRRVGTGVGLPWLLLSMLLVAVPSLAHTVSLAFLDVSRGEGDAGIRLQLDLAIRDLVLELPIDRNRDGKVTWGELSAARESIQELAISGLRLGDAAGTCRIEPSGFGIREYDQGAYAALEFHALCPEAEQLQLEYSVFFERDPRHRLIAVTQGQSGDAMPSVMTSDNRVLDLGIDGGTPGHARVSGFMDFLREGIHHILIGYDHLAFLVSLLLPAALVRVGSRWQPASGFRPGFVHVLGIVTAFTVAHSVTLSLAALDLVTPASRWVEAAIAASVLLAALNNVRPLVVRQLWLVGLAFGLIHGFGFAGALSELGLPRDASLLSLVGFNLGVEVGQIAVVSVLLPLLFAIRHRRWYPRVVLPLASFVIATIATYWLSQRLAG